MAAGIPGAGIGGLFYIVNSLLLPFRGVVRALRGEPVTWGPLFRQAALGAGVVFGIVIAGWAIGLVIGPKAGPDHAFSSGAAAQTVHVLGVAAIYMSIGTLAVVLIAVQIARLTVRRSR